MQLDHAIIIVNDLAQAIADYTSLGFTTVDKGIYSDQNARIIFPNNTFLEFVSRQNINCISPSVVDNVDGLIGFAIRVGNIHQETQRLQNLGFDAVDIEKHQKFFNGKNCEWYVTKIYMPHLLFLIQDIIPIVRERVMYREAC